jgi:hypothetical protein
MPLQADRLDAHNGSELTPEQGEVFSALKRFARTRPAVERCALCSAALEEPHQHLLDRASRQIECACDACAILFDAQEDGKYLRVPRRVRQLHDFRFTDLQWEEMMLPINLAFFLRNAEGKMVAMYPSPAGAIESLLGLDAWDERVAGCARLRALQPEVEALLVNRVGDPVYFIVPIDECYRLVGIIRTRWRGLSGGTEVWGAVAEFLRDLERKAGGSGQVHHA